MTFQLQDSAPCRGSSTLATQGEASSRFNKEVTENVSMALLLSKERPARETAVWEEGDDEGSGEEETEEVTIVCAKMAGTVRLLMYGVCAYVSRV